MGQSWAIAPFLGPASMAAWAVAFATAMLATTAQTAPRSALAVLGTLAWAMEPAVTAATERGAARALMIPCTGTGVGTSAVSAWPVGGDWWGPILMTRTTALSPASRACRATAGTVLRVMVSVSALLGHTETSVNPSALGARTTCARAMGFATGAAGPMGRVTVSSAIGVLHASFTAQACRWQTPTPPWDSLRAAAGGTKVRKIPPVRPSNAITCRGLMQWIALAETGIMWWPLVRLLSLIRQ